MESIKDAYYTQDAEAVASAESERAGAVRPLEQLSSARDRQDQNTDSKEKQWLVPEGVGFPGG